MWPRSGGCHRLHVRTIPVLCTCRRCGARRQGPRHPLPPRSRGLAGWLLPMPHHHHHHHHHHYHRRSGTPPTRPQHGQQALRTLWQHTAMGRASMVRPSPLLSQRKHHGKRHNRKDTKGPQLTWTTTGTPAVHPPTTTRATADFAMPFARGAIRYVERNPSSPSGGPAIHRSTPLVLRTLRLTPKTGGTPVPSTPRFIPRALPPGFWLRLRLAGRFPRNGPRIRLSATSPHPSGTGSTT